MCTAIAFRPKGFYFGRTLDVNESYPCEVVVTPRNFPLPFRMAQTLQTHHAIIGMAYVADGYPLYFDAMNEKGLAVAGLNFAASAVYGERQAEKDNLAQFELIPWLLGRCADVAEAKEALARINLTNEGFSAALSPSPLHWIIADREQSITVEAVKEGLFIYPNDVDVLTNEPPFPAQRLRLCDFAHLSSNPPENRFAPELSLPPYSLGMGAIGLPGDLSSPSRFVRAAFALRNSIRTENEEGCVGQFFHLLGTVEQVRGCSKTPAGRLEQTLYTSCCSADTLTYYYTTYENRRISAVDARRCDLGGRELACYPLTEGEQILRQN